MKGEKESKAVQITERQLARSDKLFESAIESKLNMTPEERIEAHEHARELMMDLRRIGEEESARS